MSAVLSAAIGAILPSAHMIGHRRRMRHGGVRASRASDRSQGTVCAVVGAPAPGSPPSPQAARCAQTLRIFLRMGTPQPGDTARARLREAVIREQMRDAWHIAVLYDACSELDEDGPRVAHRSVAPAVDGFVRRPVQHAERPAGRGAGVDVGARESAPGPILLGPGALAA